MLKNVLDRLNKKTITEDEATEEFFKANQEIIEMVEVKFKKTSNLAKDPIRMTNGACGADLTAATETLRTELTGPCIEYDTHIAVEIPKGYVGLVFPRSSITTKTTLSLGNCVGVIDSDYRGTIKFQFRTIFLQGGLNKKYKVGDRIGQIVIVPAPEISFKEVTELSNTDRGTGGFGSTQN